jgi:hypothetical protein
MPQESPLRASINLFAHARAATPHQTLRMDAALEAIRIGTYARAMVWLRKQHTAGEAAYSAAKRTLPAYTFAGTFAPTRGTKNLIQHTGIVHGDLDHLGDPEATRAQLTQDPHVLYCFTSPSGAGLKVGVCIKPVGDDLAYKHAWGVVAAAQAARYGVTWDPSGKDICRLCFVAHDPDCYANAHARPMPVPLMVRPSPVPRPVPVRPTARDALRRRVERVMEHAARMIAESVPGHQHHARIRAAYLLGGYIAGGLLTEGEAYTVLQPAVEATAHNTRLAMQDITDCLAAGQAKPITAADLDADWQAWREAHPQTTPWERRTRDQPSVYDRPAGKEQTPWH